MYRQSTVLAFSWLAGLSVLHYFKQQLPMKVLLILKEQGLCQQIE